MKNIDLDAGPGGIDFSVVLKRAGDLAGPAGRTFFRVDIDVIFTHLTLS
jgi:hypothetical protein